MEMVSAEKAKKRKRKNPKIIIVQVGLGE